MNDQTVLDQLASLPTDERRLSRQVARVYYAMLDDGGWLSLEQLERRTGDPPASVSARIRELRQPRFGGHTVERQFVANGLHRYRLIAAPCGLLPGHQPHKPTAAVCPACAGTGRVPSRPVFTS